MINASLHKCTASLMNLVHELIVPFQIMVESDASQIVSIPEGEYEDIKQVWIIMDSKSPVEVSDIMLIGCLVAGM